VYLKEYVPEELCVSELFKIVEAEGKVYCVFAMCNKIFEDREGTWLLIRCRKIVLP